MRKLKIGIDIDNVISDSYPAYIEKFNETFRTSIRYEEVVDFSFLEKYEDVGGRQSEVFIDALLRNEEFQLSLPPFVEALPIIKNWHKAGHSIHYITARPSFTKKATKKWLKKHGLMVSGVTLDCCHYGKDKPDTKFKKEVVERLGIDVLIEDTKGIAEVMNIPVLLLDRPWNQGELPKNVRRVKGWQEIEQFIRIGAKRGRNGVRP